ncbi:hypothetical protein NliqN6_2620 [Naganishia liquefaciens]|uniref:Uncharacterized protein n=1 Tax=Naganishia liquefaciens TaxID=104408 RepID=A0A8H3TSA9_9TREE|nr:hypothetical protein NliqN6_2620 [Naganishia liquefaciens]
MGSALKPSTALLSSPDAKPGADHRRMSSSLRQSVTARRVSQGGAITTTFTEEVALEKPATAQPPTGTISSVSLPRRSTSSVPLFPKAGRNRHSSRCLHEIQVQPRAAQRKLSRHQLLILTPFGTTLPLGGAPTANKTSCPAVLLPGSQTRSEAMVFPKQSALTSRNDIPPISAQPDAVLLSADMARSTSMPTFTVREDEASKAKDDALAITRGEALIWLDDSSISDQDDEMMLVTPPEHKIGVTRGSMAEVASKFSEYALDRPKHITFADPFALSERMPAAIAASAITSDDQSHSPASRKAELPQRGSDDNDPPSPTRRPSLPRYRSTPHLPTQEPTGLNILLGNAGPSTAPTLFTDSASSSGQQSDASTNSLDSRSSVSSRGSIVPMTRSIEQTEGTLASLFPRLSFAPLTLLTSRRPSTQDSDSLQYRDSDNRQSTSSRRGSWAQLNAVNFPPPITTLGREFRSRFNSIDSAFQRSSDAASVFSSLQESDWLNPGGLQGYGWSRKSSDWSTSSVRRGSDPYSRRRSSLARIAYANVGSRSPGKYSGWHNQAPSGFTSSSHSHRGSTNSGPLRDYRFGVSSLENDLPPDSSTVFQEQEQFGPTDWHTRRGSWAEV